jgi:hypothetical protein
MRSISTWQGLRWSATAPLPAPPSSGRVGTVFSDDSRPRNEGLDTANNPQDTIQKLPNRVPDIPRFTNTMEGKKKVRLCSARVTARCLISGRLLFTCPARGKTLQRQSADRTASCIAIRRFGNRAGQSPVQKNRDPTVLNCAARPNQQKAHWRCPGSKVLEPRA